MKSITINFIALISIFSLPAYACEHHHNMSNNQLASEVSSKQNISDNLIIENARLNSTIPGVKVTSGYMKITNNNDETIRFTKAKSDIAEHTEFHRMFMKSGKMLMRAVDYIEVKPNDFFELKPSDYHLMFIDLNNRLEAGEQVSLTLISDSGENYEVKMSVK